MSIIFRAAVTKRLAVVSPVLAAGMLAGGCMSSPTYGTGVSANEQLLSDVTTIVSVAPKRKDPIDYKPRPDLVRPAQGQVADLPAPQQQVASQNPDWPESPEQRRKRIRADVDANRDSANFDSPVVSDGGGSDNYTARDDNFYKNGIRSQAQAAKEEAEVRKRIVETKQGSATTRKYLSEPPLAYRQPAATAASDELGEDELKKERRAKKAATPSKGLRDYIPWL